MKATFSGGLKTSTRIGNKESMSKVSVGLVRSLEWCPPRQYSGPDTVSGIINYPFEDTQSNGKVFADDAKLYRKI